MKLFLKGDRCYTDKCAIEKRNQPPGVHGPRYRHRISEYGTQLREKQKLKRIYGMLERQMRRFFHEAARRRGITGENLLVLLERRLDNVVYRAGFAASRNQARQIVCHGHILLNEHRSDVPSLLVRPGDEFVVREKSRSHPQIREALESAARRGSTPWLEIDAQKLRGRVVGDPKREDITLPLQEQWIVEFYSR